MSSLTSPPPSEESSSESSFPAEPLEEPPPAPAYAFYQIPIRNIMEQREPVDGVPFYTGNEYTQSEGRPNSPTVLSHSTDISKPIAIYFLVNAGYGFLEYARKQIGIITLSFADGSSSTTPLVFGYNIRE